MARIKTALEIAMEKMDSIVVDENKIRLDNTKKEGKILCGKFLSDDKMTIEEVQKKLDSYSQENKKLVFDSINNTIIQNLSLPSNEAYVTRNKRIQLLFESLNPNNSDAISLLAQIMGLEEQYFDNMCSLLDNLKEQYKDALSKTQTPPEQNEQFMKIYQANVNQMMTQYTQVLSNAKEQLASLIA